MLRLPLAAARRSSAGTRFSQIGFANGLGRNKSTLVLSDQDQTSSPSRDFREALDGTVRQRDPAQQEHLNRPRNIVNKAMRNHEKRTVPSPEVKKIDLDDISDEDILHLPIVTRARPGNRESARPWRLVSNYVTMKDHFASSRENRNIPPTGYVFRNYKFNRYDQALFFIEQITATLRQKEVKPNLQLFLYGANPTVQIGLPVVLGLHVAQDGVGHMPLPTYRYLGQLRNFVRLDKEGDLSGSNRERMKTLQQEVRKRLVLHGFTFEVNGLANELERIKSLQVPPSEMDDELQSGSAIEQSDKHNSNLKTKEEGRKTCSNFAERLYQVLQEPLGTGSGDPSTPTAGTFVAPDGGQKGAESAESIEERTPVYIPGHEEQHDQGSSTATSASLDATPQPDEPTLATARTFVAPDGSQKEGETIPEAAEEIEERTPVHIPGQGKQSAPSGQDLFPNSEEWGESEVEKKQDDKWAAFTLPKSEDK